jgi:hypothetical protein
MGTNAKWVLTCKNCRAECTYADISLEGAANYFLPKRPPVPDGFTFKCQNCGHADIYRRQELLYRDETMPSRRPTGNRA